MHQTVVIGTIETMNGSFGAAVSERGLARLTFPDEPPGLCQQWVQRWWPEAEIIPDDGRLQPVAEQLQAFFRRELTEFQLDLDLQGTEFQRAVWQALQAIPYGETRSYADIAKAVGRPQAMRAVGGANHANPVPIIVPCHRVIGKSGQLVGYGGGLELKQRLLKLEGISFNSQ
jgi:methylated-DNA-[protein]-cysteine S-methyltransferase